MIYRCLKYKGGKKSLKTYDILGYNTDKLKERIEFQFKDGMSWENHGEWHIDHIIPCDAFDLTNPEEQKKCFNYINLQPLWAKDNLKKSNKIKGE